VYTGLAMATDASGVTRLYAADFIGGMENGLVNLVNRMAATRYAHAIACIEDYSSFRDRIARQCARIRCHSSSR